MQEDAQQQQDEEVRLANLRRRENLKRVQKLPPPSVAPTQAGTVDPMDYVLKMFDAKEASLSSPSSPTQKPSSASTMAKRPT